MDTNEQIKITGALTIVKTNADGVVTDTRSIPNMVVTAGKAHIISRMLGVADASMTHIGLGTDTVTAPALGQTALSGAFAGNRTAMATPTQASNVVTYVATFAAGVNTGAISEAGIFNAVTGGTMLCRTQFAVVTKGISDSIVITWVITLS
jgi:hypothetical protein